MGVQQHAMRLMVLLLSWWWCCSHGGGAAALMVVVLLLKVMISTLAGGPHASHLLDVSFGFSPKWQRHQQVTTSPLHTGDI